MAVVKNKHVVVAGLPFEIRYAEEEQLKDELYGTIKYPSQRILIRPGTPERQRRTLMHEILHGIIDEYGIRELRLEDGVHLEYPIDQLAIGLCEALESLGLMLPTKEQE